VLVLSAGCCE